MMNRNNLLKMDESPEVWCAGGMVAIETSVDGMTLSRTHVAVDGWSSWSPLQPLHGQTFPARPLHHIVLFVFGKHLVRVRLTKYHWQGSNSLQTDGYVK